MMFTRLFLRKRTWIRKKTMKYQDITGNLDSILEELISNKFIFDGKALIKVK